MLSRNLTDISRSLVTLTKPGYRMTETGEIPEEWDILPLTKVAKYINGMAFKPSDWKKQGIPIVRIENLNDSSAPFNYFDEEVDNKFLLNDGDILLSWSASLGVYIWNRGKAVLNQHIFKVVPNETVNKYYLFWALHNSVETLSKVTHGSTMKHFQKGELERTKIALPSLSEQQKIAEILSTADETIQKVNEEITLTEKLKKGLMQTLLTKGIGHTKFKMTEIGEIPEEWPLRPFSEVLQIRKRKNEGKSEKIYTIPMELIPQNETYCGYRSLNKSEVVPPTYCECGDILLPKITPSVENGKQGIVPTMPSGNAFATSEVYALFTNGSLTNIYTFYLLKLSLFRKPLIDSMVGTTGRQRVPKDSLFNLSFPVPPIPEQQKISEILTTIDHKLELLRSKKTHLEELKKGMMEDLLTGRVRVKV